MPGNIGPPSRRRVIRFSRSSSLTRRDARRCAVKGLWRNSPTVRAKLMVGTSEGDSLMRIIPPHRLLLCQMRRAAEKIPSCGMDSADSSISIGYRVAISNGSSQLELPMLDKIVDGRTDLVFEYLAQGHAANSADANGVSLIKWCAYYGDVSAIKHLLANGESPVALAAELNAAAFHGHWRLCQFLIELGHDVNQALPDTGEAPLHAALCKGGPAHDRVVKILLANGANPNSVTKPGMVTGAFMRDSRTRGETPLHRAAAFGSAESI